MKQSDKAVPLSTLLVSSVEAVATYAEDVIAMEVDVTTPDLLALVEALLNKLHKATEEVDCTQSYLRIAMDGLDFTMQELEQAIEQGYTPSISTKQMLRLIKDSND